MLGQVGIDVLEVDIGGWILRKHRRKYVRAEGIVHHIRLHRIGLGIAWNAEDPTTSRTDIIDIAITRPASALAPMIRPLWTTPSDEPDIGVSPSVSRGRK